MHEVLRWLGHVPPQLWWVLMSAGVGAAAHWFESHKLPAWVPSPVRAALSNKAVWEQAQTFVRGAEVSGKDPAARREFVTRQLQGYAARYGVVLSDSEVAAVTELAVQCVKGRKQ